MCFTEHDFILAVTCGENEEFSTEASACENSCSNPTAEQDCKATPRIVEACICKAGFILSGDKCKSKDRACGCTISAQQFFHVSSAQE